MAGPRDSEPAAEAARVRAERRLASGRWPRQLETALERLRHGDRPAYLVGGSVRDRLLDRSGDPTYDVATGLTPPRVQALFGRVEPIGLEHGTVLIIEEGLHIECTTFRREGAYPDARHPAGVTFTDDPVEDLGRRDLTVNALAYDPLGGRLLDPHGGALDLESNVLRAVGDPRVRFHEDALRPLRVARLAAVLAMRLEPATRAALGSARERARLVAWERVRDELDKMMAAPRPSTGLELMREAELLELWMPELAHCVGAPQNRFHAHDVYVHSLIACDAAPAANRRVRWAALLHDIGKPATRVERHGDGTFYNHQFVGAELAHRLLERLRFPAAEREAIVHLVREHMFDVRPEWSDGALRRWLRRVTPEAVGDLLALRRADVAARGTPNERDRDLGALRERLDALIREAGALTLRDLAVDGRDVMRVLGLPPGPEVRAVLEALLEEVLDRNELNERGWLLERLEQWRRERAHGASRS